MSVTELVVQPLKSPTVVKDEQPSNMEFMLITLLVSQPLKSRLVRDGQPENMLFISVTFFVSQPLKSPTVVKDEQLENI